MKATNFVSFLFLVAVPLLVVFGSVLGSAPDGATPMAQINSILDDWHQAAAAAQEERYFKHFTDDAIFLGTDATERWTRDEFRKWAKPYFAKGRAWSFRSERRHVTLSKEGTVAWFDEALATPNMGPCRGSGVLAYNGTTWKIAQYNLSVPIPNEAMAEVKKLIEAAAKKKP
jgi:hypothetical protein